jgi:outer membrane biosynthesis protein TonB
VKSAMRKALVLSFAIHAAIFGVAHPLVFRPAAAAPPLAPAEDRWTGTTAELPFAGPVGALYDVSLDPPAAPPAAPAPAVLPAAVPAPDLPPVPSPTRAGTSVPRPLASSPSTPASAPPRPRRRPRSEVPAGERSSSSAAGASAAPGGGAGSFGAEGAASLRDLGRAFTRAIAPASDSDPVWASVALGDAGKIEVAVHVDGSGHIASAEPRGVDPPRALVSLLRRTFVMLQAGTFAVRGREIAEGTEILALHAVVREARTEDHQDGVEYEGGRGKSEFTQAASGRHVEVTVKVLRVEAR